LHKKSDFPPEAAFFMQNTEGSKTHKRLIINPIIKRLPFKRVKIRGNVVDKNKKIF
jgi:hypothetical protein